MMLPALLLHLALAQDPPPPDPCAASAHCLVFTFDQLGAPVPHYSFEVSAEGRGRYAQAAPANDASAKQLHITVTPPTTRLLFAAAPVVVTGRCETHLKHIAKSGTKTLAITDDGHTATCTYNFSDTEALNTATTALESMASTLALGDRLEHAHRFDRLGLDAEMDILTAEARAGHAIELQNIATTLQSIMNDERLMDRVRRKAARLLQEPDPPPAP